MKKMADKSRKTPVDRTSGASPDSSPNRRGGSVVLSFYSERVAALHTRDERRSSKEKGGETEDEYLDDPPPETSCLCFEPQNPVRRFCYRLATNKCFEGLIILAIIASSVCLALDSPRIHLEDAPPDDKQLSQMLKFGDQYVWPWLFGAELMIKSIAFGFAFTKGAYLSSSWNQLDFFIVIVSFVTLLSDIYPSLHTLSNMRILRVLRPLRLVSRNPGMKLIISSLLKALPAVVNVLGVMLALMAVFAIWGMQMYLGAMGSCTNPAITVRAECVDTSHGRALESLLLPAPTNATAEAMVLGSGIGDGVGVGGEIARRVLKGGGSSAVWDGTGVVEWQNPRIGSFDNFGSAMLLLYVMSTGDDWANVMFKMMDSTGQAKAPIRNDFSWDALYAVVWMFVGSLFAMNLFVGVIVDNFNRIKKETEGSATMTAEQKAWVKIMKAMVVQKPARAAKVPENGCRKWLYDLVHSDAWEVVIMTFVVFIVGVMACDFWGIELYDTTHFLYSRALDFSAYFFYTECFIKIVALGFDGYWQDAWSRFDFFLVCGALADQFAAELVRAVLPVPPMLLRVLRVLRVLRIIRLLKNAKELRNLIMTMIYSFPSLVNVCAVLALIVFMYSVLGVDLFTFIAHQENIDDWRNFETLTNAALLLFQCLTNDAWSGLMADAMVEAHTGACSVDEGTCGSWIAIPYFISFQVLGSFVFLNLVVAIILENFTSLGSENPKLASSADVEAFKEVWAIFDPDADNFIPSRQLHQLVERLPPPLGTKNHGEKAHQMAIRTCVNLKLVVHDGGFVAFTEVLNALIAYNFKQNASVDVDDEAWVGQVKHMVPPAPAVPPTPRSPTPGQQGSGVPAPAAVVGGMYPLVASDNMAKSVPKPPGVSDVNQMFALETIAKHLRMQQESPHYKYGRTKSSTGRSLTSGRASSGRSTNSRSFYASPPPSAPSRNRSPTGSAISRSQEKRNSSRNSQRGRSPSSRERNRSPSSRSTSPSPPGSARGTARWGEMRAAAKLEEAKQAVAAAATEAAKYGRQLSPRALGALERLMPDHPAAESWRPVAQESRRGWSPFPSSRAVPSLH